MIFKILIFGIAAYALYRLFMNDKRKNIEKSENDEAKKVADGILVRDPETIDYCNANGMAMVFTGLRHFKH